DINECVTNVHNCDVNAFCNNTEGSYNCTCSPGYTGNGTSCNGYFQNFVCLFVSFFSFTTNGRIGNHGIIQNFTVPKTGVYLVKAWGARG
ncbi:unnamed protein product, partial [Porites evermanni]